MSFADTLIQAPLTALPFMHLFVSMLELLLLGGLLMFFRPLLVGLARALLLALRPRLSKGALRS